MSHWAAKYIGRSYESVGMCWGLVQDCCAERHGVEMPHIEPGSDRSQEPALLIAAKRKGWRKTGSLRPLPDDIVLMMGRQGRHVAYALEADGELRILHAVSSGVESIAWREVGTRGYRSFEFWRFSK